MKLSLTFGAICPQIGEQLAEQGLTADASDLTRWQQDADAVVSLQIRRLLSDSDAQKIRRRLLKQIVKGVEASHQAAAGADKKDNPATPEES